jgi:hypothetical protein
MDSGFSYIIIGLILVVMILALVIFLIIFILKISFFHILIEFLKLKSLTSKPVNSAGNELLLDVLAQLIVEFKTLLDIARSIIVVIVRWCLGRRKEVEEGLSWYCLLNNPGLLCVYSRLLVKKLKVNGRITYSCCAAFCSQLEPSGPCRPSSQFCHPRRGHK